MATENTDAYSLLFNIRRNIEKMCQFFQNQNSSNSPAVWMRKQDIKKIIDNLTEQAIVTIQSPLKEFEEKYYKPPQRKCTKCGKLKKAGRQLVNVVDAIRRFKHFGTQHQQPSTMRHFESDRVNSGLFSDSSTGSGSRTTRSCSSGSYSSSSTGSNYQSRSRRTSTPNTICSGSTSGD